jgi:hypothetical protein
LGVWPKYRIELFCPAAILGAATSSSFFAGGSGVREHKNNDQLDLDIETQVRSLERMNLTSLRVLWQVLSG